MLKKFPDTIHQYRDEERYPFNYDFYIPSLDLFIEYQGSWLHNNHPYDENNINDIQEVIMLKEKSKEINFKGHEKDLYQNAIYTWTDLDVRKRNIARKNNLNYLEFFNMKEFNDWLLNQ